MIFQEDVGEFILIEIEFVQFFEIERNFLKFEIFFIEFEFKLIIEVLLETKIIEILDVVKKFLFLSDIFEDNIKF